MSDRYESRDSARSTTSQLIFGLLFGNVLSFVGVFGFRPFGSAGLDEHGALLIANGVISLVTSGLLFVAAAVRRRGSIWWVLALVLNLLQMARLIVGVIAIAGWADPAEMAANLWSLIFVPLLGLLSAIGLVMTLREFRKVRRRRLSHAT